MELQTQRLKLIPCTENSVSIALHEYDIGPHISLHLDELKEDLTLNGWGPWFIYNKVNNKIIGDLGFKGKPNSENIVEIGYGIIPAEHNKGYATEAGIEILRWAFSSNQVNKIIAECLDDNISSIKVLEKLKMNRISQEKNLLKWEVLKTSFQQRQCVSAGDKHR